MFPNLRVFAASGGATSSTTKDFEKVLPFIELRNTDPTVGGNAIEIRLENALDRPLAGYFTLEYGGGKVQLSVNVDHVDDVEPAFTELGFVIAIDDLQVKRDLLQRGDKDKGFILKIDFGRSGILGFQNSFYFL